MKGDEASKPDASDAEVESTPSQSPMDIEVLQVRGLRKALYLFLAVLFLTLGIIGVIAPIIPATPFLLLASYFLIRTVPKVNEWLLNSRVFGPILIDWQVNGGVRPDIKIKAVVIVAIAVSITIFVSGVKFIPTIAVLVLAAIGIFVIIKLPVARHQASSRANGNDVVEEVVANTKDESSKT